MFVKTETENIIELEGINKSYQQPNGQQITIIENISLTFFHRNDLEYDI